MTTAVEIAPNPPRARRWRAACLVFVALGCVCYFGSRYLLGAEIDAVSPSALIQANFNGPALSVLLLALWFAIRGPGRWTRRLLVLFAAVLAVVGFVMAAHTSARFVAAVWGVPSVVGATVLALALLPRKFALGAVVAGVAAAARRLTSRLTGTTGDFNLVFAPRWSKTAEELAAEHRSSGAAAAKVAAIPAPTVADWPGLRGANGEFGRAGRGARRLGRRPAEAVVATPGRPGVVLVRLRRRLRHHAGAARQGRGRRLLPGRHRRRSLGPSGGTAARGFPRRPRPAGRRRRSPATRSTPSARPAC